MKLANRIDISLLILRLTGGGLMLIHGIPKFVKLLDGNLDFADPIGLGSPFTFVLAVFTEFLGSIFIVLGLFTRISAILLCFTMGIATFVVHYGDGLEKQELPLLYFGIYLALAFSGAGKYSLDNRFNIP